MRSALAALLLGALVPIPASAHLDVVFLIDTTGSMSGEIREAKERVLQIAAALRKARENERVRIGVVAYRDRGDEYVTKVSPLSEDVARAHDFLAALTADGGGDTPEDVLSGVRAALREAGWDEADDAERQVFLVGDAPPQLHYQDGPGPDALIEEARRRRVVVHAIGCRSLSPAGVAFFRSLAYQTEGTYQHIGRVEVDGPQEGLAEAMLEALAADPGTGPLSPVVARRSSERASESRVLAVELVDEDGAAKDAGSLCALRVAPPPGLALAGDPDVRLGAQGLEVGLRLAGGAARATTFVLSTCVPATTPVLARIGG